MPVGPVAPTIAIFVMGTNAEHLRARPKLCLILLRPTKNVRAGLIPSCAPFYEQKAMSAQRLDQAPKLDSRFGSGTVAVISIPLAFRRAASSAVHSADLPTSHSRRTTGLPSPLRSGSAPRGRVSLLHGVVAHFAFDPPPSTGTVSFWVGSMIFIGLSVLAVSNLLAMVSFPLSVTI
jgi:hypothetical protein